ncbi:MAG: hypothetical protein HYY17_16985 [Planctomycetes bacterium]|nr:hypothetical protein [Planctomycetota bacterium]
MTTRLFAILACGACLSAGAQDDPMETRVYNVESLTIPIQDSPGEFLGLTPEQGQPAVQEEAAEGFLDADTLVHLIRSNVAEDTWEDAAARISFAQGVLTVTNRKSVHEKIAAYLAYWRGVAGKLVAVDASFVRIDAALLAKIRAGGATDRPAAISPAQAKQILDAAREGNLAEILQTMRVTASSGQRVSLADTVKQAFVRDYDVQIATGAVALDPIMDVLAAGTALDVRPLIEPFGGAVTLEVRATVADLETMDPRKLKLAATVGGGVPNVGGEKAGLQPGAQGTMLLEAKIDLPKIARQAIRTTVTIRERETLLVAAGRRGDRSLVLLLTPAVIQPEEKPAPEPVFDERRLLRVYDVSPLTRATADFPGPRLDMPSAGTTMTGATFTLEEPGGVRVDIADLVELVRTRIAPDTWSNKRNFIAASPRGHLVVRQKPEVLQEIDRFLGSLLASRAVMITTEGILVGFRKGSRSEWEKEIPALGAGGYFVEPEKVERLLAEAAKGGSVRLIDRAEVTGFPQERVHVAHLREETFVADYDSQISTLAACRDPRVSILTTGFVFDVRPHFVSGADRIALDLRSAHASRDMTEIEEPSTGIGLLQVPRLAGMRWNARVTCVKDRYSVAAVQSRRAGNEVEDLVLFVRARGNVLK